MFVARGLGMPSTAIKLRAFVILVLGGTGTIIDQSRSRCNTFFSHEVLWGKSNGSRGRRLLRLGVVEPGINAGIADYEDEVAASELEVRYPLRLQLRIEIG